MINSFIEITWANNIALLLAMIVIFNYLLAVPTTSSLISKLIAGSALSGIALIIMMTPWHFSEDIFFDTRSILLSATGLFFGVIPTLIVCTVAAVYRFTLGGAFFTGILVIITTASIGLIWRHYRHLYLDKLSFYELFIFGIVTHIATLLLMLTLPGNSGYEVLQQITLPVLTIFPLTTALLCSFFVNKIRQNSISDSLKINEARLESLYQHAPIGLWEEDWSEAKKVFDTIPKKSLSDLQAYFINNPSLCRELATKIKVVTANKAAIQQASANDITNIKGPLSPFINDSALADFALELAEIASGKLSFSHQNSFAGANQTNKTLSIKVAVLPQHQETLSHVITTTLDITAQIKSEESIRLAEGVYEYSNEAVLITDATSKIIHINKAFTEITGYSYEDSIGNTPSILSSGKHDEAFYQQMREALLESGIWEGEIWNRRKNGELYLEWLTINAMKSNSEGLVDRYIGLFTDISQKKASEEKLWEQANFDPLTGLPNRKMLRDRIVVDVANALKSDSSLALLYINLDRFKVINDLLSHEAGDLLIYQASQRLNKIIRNTDMLARLGGDEFAISINELNSTNVVERIAQKVLDTLSLPFSINNEELFITASIGIAICPDDAKNASALIQNADHALFSAKRKGRGRYQYFIPSMQEKAMARSILERDLRAAIEHEQFELYYQPIVELSSGKTFKAEALIRWHHPSRGLVSPAEFIPIAEDSGLITHIGDWVFRDAARQAAVWQNQYDTSFSISINTSPFQFHDPTHDVLSWLQFMEQLGLSARSVVIEITESMMIEPSDEIQQKMRLFREAGVQIALDDFGTGYSSLSYLKNFDVDFIKIDQSFVRGLTPHSDDKVLCEAIIMIAHKLGMQVIAEGIETEEEYKLLTKAGCDYGQGFYFDKPMPRQQFEKAFIEA
jgi:diguanylate cyclase (GGDEF)-like protein/PAS domain S-box-containing protein